MEPKLELERPQQVPDLRGKVRMEVETCSLGVRRGAEAWSLSEHSPRIEREGCGLSSLCGAQGRGSVAALEARTQAQHRVFPGALTFVE